jgi:hypothetical protein
VATEHEELSELITAWPLLSADLRVAILAIVRSADVAEETFLAATECEPLPDAGGRGSDPAG